MSTSNVKKSLAQKKERSYLNRDFNSFKSELLRYVRTYFPDQIQDFSDTSLGGMFNDMTSYVGDVMSFYLDHQFNEINLETAVEPKNIERQIRLAGVKIQGASPATCQVSFYVKVESELSAGSYQPKKSYLPIIKARTKLQSSNGTIFELLDDLDFTKEENGELLAEVSVLTVDNAGNPLTYSLKLDGLCSSGETNEEKFVIPNSFVPFRTITLSKNNVSEIISVVDSDLNEFYEVDALSSDVVFKRVINRSSDKDAVPDNMYIVPAPYRYTTRTTLNTALTTLIFGSGRADTLDDDILPDPSEIALPLYGDRKTFTKVALDPNALLQTKSLGVSPVNTTLTILYRSGGGLTHNVSANSIRTITSLVTKFGSSVPSTKIAQIRSSIEVKNESSATGGENIPSLNEFRNIALNFKNSQSRIVTRPDLIARVYSMPPNFGRVFRVGTRSNPTNPLASLLYIVSRDKDGYLTISPDSLKRNLSKYLNEFRLTSDAYDIIDASVINYAFVYSVVLSDSVDSTTTIQTINDKIASYLSVSNFQIDQPVVVSDILNIIINQFGVISLERYKFNNRVGSVEGRTYSDVTYNLSLNTERGLVYPPAGGIFELKYADYDIIGNAV